MAKRRMYHPVKPKPPAGLKKVLAAHTVTQEQINKLDENLGLRMEAMLKEQHGDISGLLSLIRLEHKAIKALLIKKGIMTANEITDMAEVIKKS